MSTDWKNMSYDSILIVVNRLTKMVYYEPVQITSDAPALAAGYTPLELDCNYHSRVFYEEDIDPRSKSNIANPFPPDHWGYVHGFGYR